MILSKLPDEIKLIISRKFGNNIWDAENVLDTLEHELRAREKITLVKGHSSLRKISLINFILGLSTKTTN